MSPASRTLGVIGLVLAISGQAGGLQAQARDSTSPSPFDAIARRTLALKVQTEIMRGRLGDGWQLSAWSDSLVAMGRDVERLSAETRRVAPQLTALVERVRLALETLARSRDQRSARTALTHLGAGLDALSQKIAEGEALQKEE